MTVPAQHNEDILSTPQAQPFVTVACGFVQIETTEQVVILGLARGTYKCRLPLEFGKLTETVSTKLPQTDTPTPNSQHLTCPVRPEDCSTQCCVSKAPRTGATAVFNRSPSSQSTTVVEHSAPLQPFSGQSVVTEPPPTVGHLLLATQSVSQVDTVGQTVYREPTTPKQWIYIPPNVKKPNMAPLKFYQSAPLSISTTPRETSVLPHRSLSLASGRDSRSAGVARSSEMAPSSSAPPSQSSAVLGPTTSLVPPVRGCPSPCPPIMTSRSLIPSHLPFRGPDWPIPDKWISSGRFQPLMLDSGSPSQLVLESVSGGVFHRTTGRLVFHAPPGSSPLLLSPPTSTCTTTSSDATISSVISNSVTVFSADDSSTALPKSALELSHGPRWMENSLSIYPASIPPQPSAPGQAPLQTERISTSNRVVGARFKVGDKGQDLIKAASAEGFQASD
uniref:Uncharacterized protein n=3 Tax=Schistocephalus solidus TaxID=70667 RepID=A0A0V0J965_SCHSO